jgi:uncharacterized protein (UPF0264 family)
LLVSVRSKIEAIEAIAGGVDILDIKEPANGSLGMATSGVISEIAETVHRQTKPVPVSVALGELIDWTNEAPLLPTSVTFAKVGLSGLQRQPDWRRSWLSFRNHCETLRQQPIRWVAVAYADAVEASSPTLPEILQAAIETGCAGFLIDTHGKAGKSLLDHVPVAQLCEIAEECHRARIFLAIAGRLTIETLPEVCDCQPDILAIRSAACQHGNRQDSVEASRVASFRDAIHRIHQKRNRISL